MTERLEPRLADFLRAARSRLSPDMAGIVDAGRRRVEGLCREERAMLAGVSVDYYTRLEQGRSKSASSEVLDALADAFRLDDTERAHLHTIAHPASSCRRQAAKPQRLDPAIRELLETFEAVLRPAFVLGCRLDVLGHNLLAGRPAPPALAHPRSASSCPPSAPTRENECPLPATPATPPAANTPSSLPS